MYELELRLFRSISSHPAQGGRQHERQLWIDSIVLGDMQQAAYWHTAANDLSRRPREHNGRLARLTIKFLLPLDQMSSENLVSASHSWMANANRTLTCHHIFEL
jgi:hypothetical protein